MIHTKVNGSEDPQNNGCTNRVYIRCIHASWVKCGKVKVMWLSSLSSLMAGYCPNENMGKSILDLYGQVQLKKYLDCFLFFYIEIFLSVRRKQIRIKVLLEKMEHYNHTKSNCIDMTSFDKVFTLFWRYFGYSYIPSGNDTIQTSHVVCWLKADSTVVFGNNRKSSAINAYQWKYDLEKGHGSYRGLAGYIWITSRLLTSGRFEFLAYEINIISREETKTWQLQIMQC